MIPWFMRQNFKRYQSYKECDLCCGKGWLNIYSSNINTETITTATCGNCKGTGYTKGEILLLEEL